MKDKHRGPVVEPGGTIGILGGGQLGRMLALAAARLGLRAHIYCEEADEIPAADIAASVTTAPYDREEPLRAFADAVDVITLEFENVPFETVQFLSELKPTRPGARGLRVAQDRLQEKTFLNGIGIPTTQFSPVGNGGELVTALQRIGVPSILKTRRLGYDGKGQIALSSLTEREMAWETVKRAPSILEAHVPFERELSVIVARGSSGEVVTYDIAENVHDNHVLRRTAVPARLDPAQDRAAHEMAAQIVSALDYIGVMGVELFEMSDGGLLVNEIAPRVHNSGHWTLDGCAVSQFEQHIRAIAGWPLGSTDRHSDAIMENILGDEVAHYARLLDHAGAAVHLYGKREIRPGRKMGHFTQLLPLGQLAGG